MSQWRGNGKTECIDGAPDDDVAGTYVGYWASNSYGVSGRVVFVITKNGNEYQGKASFTGSEYFSADSFKVTITKMGAGIFRMDYKGIKTKISGTGLFTNGRFDGDYRFRSFIWVDTGKWILMRQ